MPINSVQQEGNLTRDPDVATTSSGKTVLKFSIAQTTRRKNETTGQWEDGDASFFDVEFWPSDPQYWIKRLGKGTGVVVIGELKQDRWEKDGKTNSRVVIRASSIVSKWLPELGSTATAAPAPSGQTRDDPNDIPF